MTMEKIVMKFDSEASDDLRYIATLVDRSPVATVQLALGILKKLGEAKQKGCFTYLGMGKRKEEIVWD